MKYLWKGTLSTTVHEAKDFHGLIKCFSEVDYTGFEGSSKGNTDLCYEIADYNYTYRGKHAFALGCFLERI